MKKLIAILVVLLLAGIAGYFVLNNPLGRLVKLAVEEFGPKMTQADVHVGEVQIAAADGQGTMSGLVIGNPKGFKTDYALKADTVDIAIEPASITQDVVVIHKILIDAPRLIYEKGNGGSNFDAIQHNVEQYPRSATAASWIFRCRTSICTMSARKPAAPLRRRWSRRSSRN